LEIRLAETAGFCFGVQRAVELTLEAAEKGAPVFTFGPIVHNDTVIRDFAEKGVRVSENIEELRGRSGTLVIRAHGVRKDTEKELRSTGLEVVDATCPFVKKIHRLVEKHSREGERILILGDPSHPEVRGILGWSENGAEVIEGPDDPSLKKLPKEVKYFVVAQTTFNFEKFKKIVEYLDFLSYDVTVANTICNATKERQEEAGRISSAVDVMLVIGSPSSSNSCKLYSICAEQCSHTYFIQSDENLMDSWFQSVKCVGITAGASTPKKIIEEVQKHVGEF